MLVGGAGDSEAVDFEAEGLLQELEGKQREARLRLLERLDRAGFTLEHLREAVTKDRLVVLTAEHALGEEARYTGARSARRP